MKVTKKLFSILLVLTLVLSLGASAYAATVTINDEDADSTYTAYQLLKATYDETSQLYQYELNESFVAAVAAGVSAAGGSVEVTKDNEEAVIQYLSEMTEEQTRQFADAAFKAIEANEGMKALGVNAEGKVFTDMNGYYLISETVGSGAGTATSLVMLRTAGAEDIQVDTKEEHPSSEKKLKEKNDTTGFGSEWQDGADWDIGDHVPYRLKAVIIDAHYGDYSTYNLQYVDTMSKGLTYDAGSTTIYYIDKDQIRHDLSAVEPTSADYAGTNQEYTDGHVLTWDLGDIKAQNVPAGAEVYVEYTCTLNTGANIGAAGNPNEMHIVYSNNPYGEGTGHTPDDKVIVFTFDMDVDKVDGADKALGGAAFTLLKKIPALPEGASVVESLEGAGKDSYYQIAGEDGAMTTYVVVGVSTASEETTHFDFVGLDSGEYLLVESTVPEGFNKADDIAFTVAASYDTKSDEPVLTDLTVTPSDSFTVNMQSGNIATKITNLTGLELPSTGGIGTTIFYVVGALLVAGAAVLLVTKKRMSGTNK